MIAICGPMLSGCCSGTSAILASSALSPMTYVAGGRQFVVIAAGGHARLGTKFGDAIVAFALPAADAGSGLPEAILGGR